VDTADALRDYIGENERRLLALLRENHRLQWDLDHGFLDAEMVRRRAVLLVGLGEHRGDDLALMRVPRTRLGRALLRVAVVIGEVARAVG
jgi:hypothetical protein